MSEEQNLAREAFRMLELATKNSLNLENNLKREDFEIFGIGNKIQFILPKNPDKNKHLSSVKFIKDLSGAISLYAEAIEKGHALSEEELERLIALDFYFDPKNYFKFHLHMNMKKENYNISRSVERKDGTIIHLVNLNKKLLELEEKASAIFQSSSSLDYQNFPYPKFSPEHIREIASSISQYFDRYKKVMGFLEKEGIRIK